MNLWVFLLGYKLIWVLGLWGYAKQLDGVALVLALLYVSRASFLFVNKVKFLGYVFFVAVLGLFFEAFLFEHLVYRFNMSNQGMPFFFGGHLAIVSGFLRGFFKTHYKKNALCCFFGWPFGAHNIQWGNPI